MIAREIAGLLPGLFGQYPFVSVTGPRQSGKTTLCKAVFADAGVAYVSFYPRIIDQRLEPRQALADYFETYVERDVRQLGGVGDLSAFRQFAALCAGRVGGLLDFTSLGDDVGVSRTTVRNWLAVLERSYIVFLLQPFHANIRKRLVKTPKLYFYDVGLAAHLLGIQEAAQIATHPLRGQLFENVVVAETVKHCHNRGRQPRISFYRESGGLECDLFYETGRGINAIEAKSGATVATHWMRPLGRVANTVAAVTAQTIVYGGDQAQSRTQADIVPLSGLPAALERFDTEAAPAR